MRSHIRANALLVALTLLLCCGLYPLILWAVGRTVFRDQADGSLILGDDKKPIGSRLIAQGFGGDEYFQPRPSATSPSGYNAMASSGSNLAASNPKLRGRVAQQLGPIVRYNSPNGPGKGALVGEDIEKWFQKENDPKKGDKRRDLTAEWASTNSSLIAGWATSSDDLKAYITQWAKDHAGVLEAWKVSQYKAANPDKKDPPQAQDLAPFKLDDATNPADLAPFLFDPEVKDSFVKLHPGMWLCTVEVEKAGKKEKVVKPDNKGDEIKSIFFDMWLQDHKDVKLEPVPADMVMASGSGLDPHITLKNAMYQLHRVAPAWAEKTGKKEDAVRVEIETLLRENASAPLGGLAGAPLVNVLEINVALRERMKAKAK